MEQLFDLLGHPGWFWLAAGLVLLILEMATGTLFLLGPGMAALVTALGTAVIPGQSLTTQLVVFAVAAVALTAAGRSKRVRDAVQRSSDRPMLNRKADQLRGRRVSATQDFEGGEGAVKLNDTRYLARLVDGRTDRVATGAALVIQDVQGATLLVAPAPGEQSD